MTDQPTKVLVVDDHELSRVLFCPTIRVPLRATQAESKPPTPRNKPAHSCYFLFRHSHGYTGCGSGPQAFLRLSCGLL